MAVNKYLLIMTLNVSVLSALIQRHRKAEWIRNCFPYIWGPQETHHRKNDLDRLKVKG